MTLTHLLNALRAGTDRLLGARVVRAASRARRHVAIWSAPAMGWGLEFAHTQQHTFADDLSRRGVFILSETLAHSRVSCVTNTFQPILVLAGNTTPVEWHRPTSTRSLQAEMCSGPQFTREHAATPADPASTRVSGRINTLWSATHPWTHTCFRACVLFRSHNTRCERRWRPKLWRHPLELTVRPPSLESLFRLI